MNAAYDKITSFTSGAAQSRSIVRRDKSKHMLESAFHSCGKSLREWGYGTGLYEIRLKGRHPVKLLGSPDDPAPGNATLGAAIFGGDMLHMGEQHKIDPDFWKTIKDRSLAFRTYAHSFHWLQDLAQTNDQAKARDAAETITDWWLSAGQRWDAEIWQAETLSRRVINWLVHAPLILSSLDLVYRSKVLLLLARQARHLTRVQRDAGRGLPSVYSGTALTLAGLLLPGGDKWLAKGLKFLEPTVRDFILPDGGTKSHNPADSIRVMQLLILVRQAFVDTNSDLPNWVQVTLDRIAPFVRGIRHGDGSFAQFGGVSAEGGHGTSAILAASEAKGKATENALHTGYQRITSGTSCLIMDSGTPPAWPYMHDGHASTAGIEFSSGEERLFISVGPASKTGPHKDLVDMTRTTAAHSCLTISDTNSSRVLPNGKLGPGVMETLTIRETLDGGMHVKVMHDGYLKRYGVKHERSMSLTDAGRHLSGIDRVFGSKLKKLEGETIHLRFHLHPNVEATKAPDDRISLLMRSGKVWIFAVDKNAVGASAPASIEIEDSLYMRRPDKPEGTRQIVITLKASGKEPPMIAWALNEVDV